MPRTIALIDDFSTGEVSPLTEAKVSSDEFQDGLRESTNIIPDSHGPVIGRPGFKQIRAISVPAEGKSVTLFDISYASDIYFMVVLYHQVIEVCTQDGAILHTEATVFTDTDLHGPNGDKHLAHAFLNPGGKKLVILTGQHVPHEVEMVSPASPGDPWTVVFGAISFLNPPAAWTDGNYPTTGTYYQGRTWWAGCVDNPDNFWASKSTDPYDLGYDATPGPTDGIDFQISKHGRIRWIQGARHLLIGTEGGEFIVTAETTVITPSDINVELQSAFGSKRLQSELIGNEVIYVTSDGRKLRSMWWKWVEAGWVSLDATFTAEHMTEPIVEEIAFCRNPYSNVWMLLANGDLIACTYRREQDDSPIVGWFRVSSDAMSFVSITPAQNLGISDLWVVAKSKKEGEHLFHMMSYTPLDYFDDTAIYLDDYVLLENANTDRPNFAGKFFDTEIAVIADGFHIPDAKMDEDGYIQLPIVANTIAAGYPYSQRIQTMPLIKQTEETASTHHMKRWNKVYLRLLKSYMPLVNGERPPERNVTTPDDTAEPFINSFIQVTPGFGWDRDGILTIEQDLPFRLILTGIYGEVSVDNV